MKQPFWTLFKTTTQSIAMRQTGWKTRSLTFFTLRLQRPAALVPLRTDVSCTGVGQFIPISVHFWTHLPISHTGDLLSAYVSLPPSLFEGRGVSKLTEDEVAIQEFVWRRHFELQTHFSACYFVPPWASKEAQCREEEQALLVSTAAQGDTVLSQGYELFRVWSAGKSCRPTFTKCMFFCISADEIFTYKKGIHHTVLYKIADKKKEQKPFQSIENERIFSVPSNYKKRADPPETEPVWNKANGKWVYGGQQQLVMEVRGQSSFHGKFLSAHTNTMEIWHST